MTPKTREEKARERAACVALHPCRYLPDEDLAEIYSAIATAILKTEDEAVKEWAFWSNRLLSELPKNRDWLDPDIERNLKSLIEKYSNERKEV